MEDRKINKRRILEAIALIVFSGIILFIVLNTGEAKKLVSYVVLVFKPFIYGFCIAFVINLLVKLIDDGFAKHAAKRGKEFNPKKKRVLSIILSILAYVAFAALAIGLVIPNLKDTVVSLYKQAPAVWDRIIEFLDKTKVEHPKLASFITSAENSLTGYFDKTVDYIKNNVSNIASTALGKIKDVSNILINFGLGFIIAFAALVYKEKLIRELFAILEKIFPKKHYDRISYLLKLTNKKFEIFLKYNLVQAVITGVGTFFFMLVLNMPYKASISLLITVTQLVPVIGAILGTAVGAILILPENLMKAIIFIVLSIVVQQLVEKLINPHLMGKELEMPGIITFLAVMLGGKEFGLMGLICSVPLISVVYDVYTLKLRPRIYSGKEKITEETKEETEEKEEIKTE
ncbi:MAG: AI-2E family transporter [Eubacterium sp.]|nr:AI-2E family transporter [Eubacterium sp.]